MNQQRLQAYLDVIQGLLSCPRGEEWILLRQNPELVNAELVEVMEQVASYLAAEGDIKTSKYLHNWAGKLHHILTESIPVDQNNKDKAHAYMELIQALLSCPQGSESEILAAHEDLIGPELVKVMKQIASQMAMKGETETATYLHDLATKLNHTWLKSQEFKPTLKKQFTPAPWFDEDSSGEDKSVPEAQPSDTSVIEKPPATTISSPQTQTDNREQIAQQLNTIADSLVRLEATLATRLPPANPLWYMDILEKALAANWILTTEEVEHLMGIKPHCHHEETSFQRGSWVFIKTGKIGAQAGWRVQKTQDG